MTHAKSKAKSVKKNYVPLFFGMGLLILVITFPKWVTFPAHFLLVEDQLQKADAIVVLRGGREYFRFRKATALYNQRYAPKIIFSIIPSKVEGFSDYYKFMREIYARDGEDVTQRQFVLKAFAYFGKGPEGIEFTEMGPVSTYEEALSTRQYLLRKGYRSIILLTGTYHMRRSYMIFKWIMRGTGIRVFPVTAEDEFLNPKQWWQKERDVRRIGQEYLSMMFNLFYHFILRRTGGAFDT